MRGELDFEESLRARVALLAGLRRVRPGPGVRRAGARPGRADPGAHPEAARLPVRDRLRRLHPGHRPARRRPRHRLRARPTSSRSSTAGSPAGSSAPIVDRAGKAEALRRFAARGRRPRGRDGRHRRRRQRPRHARAPPASASPSTPSRWCRRPPTRRSTCPTSTRSSTCSASAARRSRPPTPSRASPPRPPPRSAGRRCLEPGLRPTRRRLGSPGTRVSPGRRGSRRPGGLGAELRPGDADSSTATAPGGKPCSSPRHALPGRRRRRRGSGTGTRRWGCGPRRSPCARPPGRPAAPRPTTSALPVNTASSNDTSARRRAGGLDHGRPRSAGSARPRRRGVVGQRVPLAQVGARVPRAGRARGRSARRSWSLAAKGSAFACRITIRRRRSVTGPTLAPRRLRCMPNGPDAREADHPTDRTPRQDPDRSSRSAVPRTSSAAATVLKTFVSPRPAGRTPRSPWSRPRSSLGPEVVEVYDALFRKLGARRRRRRTAGEPRGGRGPRRRSACSTTSPASS